MNYYFLTVLLACIAVLPLWQDAHIRKEYGKRPLFFMLAIILLFLLGVLEAIATQFFSAEILKFRLSFTSAHMVIFTGALMTLEYSVHQQRIQRSHLVESYRNGARIVFIMIGAAAIFVVITFLMELFPDLEASLTIGPVAFYGWLLSMLALAVGCIMVNSLNGIQDGVIRRKVYPFNSTIILIVLMLVALRLEVSFSFPFPIVIFIATVVLFTIRAYHEYFVYRMHHLSDIYRKQIEMDITRTSLINQVLTSSAEADHKILFDTMSSFMKQLEESVPNKVQAFKSMVIYQRKGDRLVVTSPDFIFKACSPLITSDSVKRMNQDEARKHIMSLSFLLEDLKAPLRGKPEDFATDAFRRTWAEKGPVTISPLPPNLKSMYKLITLYPVINQEELIGMVVLYKDKDGTEHIFPQEDKILHAYSDILSIIFTIINGKEVQEEKNRLSGEMNTAKNIQTSILPPSIPLAGYETTSVMVTASEVGGDLYDIGENATGRYLDIGDVSGHGLPSGLMSLIHMSAFQSALITADIAKKELTTSDLYDIVNKTLVLINRKRIGSDKFMTCNILQEKNGTFNHAGAHLSALLYRKSDNKVHEMPGMMDRTAFLGISEHIKAETSAGSFKMDTGDILVLYTDGLIEARDRENRFFGLEGVIDVLERSLQAPVEEIKDKILAKLAEFAAAGDLKKHGGKYADDVSMVILRKI